MCVCYIVCMHVNCVKYVSYRAGYGQRDGEIGRREAGEISSFLVTIGSGSILDCPVKLR